MFFSLSLFSMINREPQKEKRQPRGCRFFVLLMRRCPLDSGVFLWAAVALAAVGTAVADEAAGAVGALAAVARGVAVAVGDGPAERVAQCEVLRAALVIHAGTMGHAALQAFGGKMVVFAVFDKVGAGFNETESGIGGDAFVAEALHPFKMAGAGAVVIFAATDDLLDLAGGKGGRQADRADEGRTHDAFVLERQLQQQGQAFVGAALVFAGDIKEDVVPTVAPVAGQAAGDALRTFGEQVEDDVAALAHDGPGFVAPRVCLGQKEVGGHADAEHFASANFVVAMAVFGEGVAHVGGAVDPGAVSVATNAVKVVHVAVGAAFADFDAAVPWVPDVVHGGASFPGVYF